MTQNPPAVPAGMEVVRPPRSRPRWGRRALVAATATVLSAGTALGLAAPAQAWPWSPELDVIGFASCTTVPNALDTPASWTWVSVESTGETAEQPVDGVGYWEAHLRAVPPEGSWAAVWIYCKVPGAEPEWRFAGNVVVARPWVGTASRPRWVRA